MLRLLVLGTSSAVPAHGRLPTAQVLTHAERVYLLDCGEGTQLQLARHHVRLRRLEAIFISHLHGDHIYGLPGLITSMSLFGREQPVRLIGPPGLAAYIHSTLRLSEVNLRYDLVVQECSPTSGTAEVVLENAALRVSAFPLRHRVPCLGYRFDEAPKLPRFDVRRAEADGIPRQLFGLIKRGYPARLPDGTAVDPQPYLSLREPSYSYAFCTDTGPCPEMEPLLSNVDLLYHEATFLHELQARARETGHSTAREAAEVALRVDARRLLLGHFSARYDDLQPLLTEATTVFKHTELAREGVVFTVPAETKSTLPQ